MVQIIIILIIFVNLYKSNSCYSIISSSFSYHFRAVNRFASLDAAYVSWMPPIDIPFHSRYWIDWTYSQGCYLSSEQTGNPPSTNL